MQVFFLRFLATGLSYEGLAFSFRMGVCTVQRIVMETCEALWAVFQQDHMPAPTTAICQKAAEDFWRLWNFPNCFGAIDGKHIRIKCPAKSGSLYYNYKQFYSLALQGVADAKCKFLAIDVGAMGRQSDGGVFNNSDLFKCLENNVFGLPASLPLPITQVHTPLVLVGDEAYPLLQYLMRPFPRVNLTREKKIYNYRLSRARRCIECAFGIMSQKFRILLKPIETNVANAEKIIKACCILHNIIIEMDSSEVSMYDQNATPTNDNLLPRARKRQAKNVALQARQRLQDFFNSEEGRVPWQDDMIQ